MTGTALVLRAAAVAALLAVAGCGGGGGGDGDTGPRPADTATEVRPFTDVQASDFVFEPDPIDPQRGIFHVVTTEPMICAIVWGETEAFGNMNNSLSMNGTGIVDHDVFLPGAIPGRTYYFQVQGTTADGTIYRSARATFTLPSADSTVTSAGADVGGTNLALGATVAEVSSEFSDAFAATNAIDGSTGTEWSTAGDGDDAYLTLDLGAVHNVSGVEFLTRSMADGTAITESFTVTVDDGAPLGPFRASTVASPNVAVIAASGRIVRVDVDTSTGGNVGATEIRVLGT